MLSRCLSHCPSCYIVASWIDIFGSANMDKAKYPSDGDHLGAWSVLSLLHPSSLIKTAERGDRGHTLCLRAMLHSSPDPTTRPLNSPRYRVPLTRCLPEREPRERAGLRSGPSRGHEHEMISPNRVIRGTMRYPGLLQLPLS